MPWRALPCEVDRAAAEAFSDALLEAGAQSVALETGWRASWRSSCRSTRTLDALIDAAARSRGHRRAAYSSDDGRRTRTGCARARRSSRRCGSARACGSARPGTHAARTHRRVRIDPGPRVRHRQLTRARSWCWPISRERFAAASACSITAAAPVYWQSPPPSSAQRTSTRVDIDPQAVETAAANARANGVELNATLPDALAAADYDLVVANILAQPLIVLAPLLARARAGGDRALRHPRDAGGGGDARLRGRGSTSSSRQTRRAGCCSQGRGVEPGRRAAPIAAPRFACSATSSPRARGTVRCGKCGDMFDGVAALVVEGAEQLALGSFAAARPVRSVAAAGAGCAPPGRPTRRCRRSWRTTSRRRAGAARCGCCSAWSPLAPFARSSIAFAPKLRSCCRSFAPRSKPPAASPAARCRCRGAPELIRIVSDDMHDDPQSPGVRSARAAAKSRALPATVPGDRAHADTMPTSR